MTKVPRTGLAPGADGKPRCFWGVSSPDYVDYHDREWGFPMVDDRRLLEKHCLEGCQSVVAGVQAPRLHVRRADHGLGVHAGDEPRRRSPRGRQQGSEQGRQQGFQDLLLRLLPQRSGDKVDAHVERRVATASIEQLDAGTARVLSAATLAELLAD